MSTRAVCAVLLSLLGALGACSSSSSGAGDGTCPAYCSSACQALDQCHVAVGDTCVSDCTSGIGTTACGSLRPVSQFTCDEIQGFYDCASYCVAFCKRAPTCGGFDENLCLQGCGSMQPPVCNAASVPVRTCDQLKPEARNYQDAASAQNSGGGTVIGAFSPQAYGLCENAYDCADNQACLTATNTCGACKTDADCSRGAGLAYACMPGGACAQVDCLTSDDCGSEVCNVPQHACVQCLTDADCAAMPTAQLAPKCSTGNLCLECATDADCTATGLGGTCRSGFCS